MTTFTYHSRMFDAAKIAPSQIDYPGIGDTMVATQRKDDVWHMSMTSV